MPLPATRNSRRYLPGGGPWPFLVLAAMAACGGGEAPAPPAPAGTLTPLTAAAAWEGVLPCADCSGIRTTVVLHPDGTWRKRSAYLGKAPETDTLFVDFGRWTVSRDRDRVTLHGTGESMESLSPRTDGSLRMLDRSGEEIVSRLNYSLASATPVPDLVGPARVTGAFTYMADAPGLVECRSGIRLPVAQEGEYLTLERAYLAGPTEPGAPLTVWLRGRVEERPAMEGDGTETTFVVESFDGEATGAGCDALAVQDALASGEWRLSALDGAGVRVPDGGEVPSMIWDRAGSGLAGAGGCNRYTGRGFLRGTLLVAGPLATTRRYCEGTMELEERFLALVSGGGVLRLDGQALVLFDGPLESARFVRP